MIPGDGAQSAMPPEFMQALLGQMGGGAPPQQAEAPKDWLAELLNSAHAAMIAAQDPQEVSVLGKIMDLLTTVQAKRATAQG